MAVQRVQRNASLEDLRDLLVDQHGRKIDVVVPTSQMRFREGDLQIKGTEPVVTEDGVSVGDGLYVPTAVFDEGVSDKLGIPLAYVRRMRNERPDLYDSNANGLLHGRRPLVRGGEVVREEIPGDERSFLVRGFRGDNEHEKGVGRAFLSDRYSVMDNIDVLTAALDGVARAGVEVEIEGCDLTDRRMYVRVKAPSVTALAPTLLAGYRSPFSGQTGAENPVVSSGFVITNSETGSGAFTIVPRLLVEVCQNGLTVTKDALRAVHLGGRMDDGVVRWSQDTEEKTLALVTARARDAVETFLDVEYMQRVISEAEEKSELEIKEPELVRTVTKQSMFTKEQQDAVFGMFVKSGQMTVGGVMNAVTAAARAEEDPESAHEMESRALRVLDAAAIAAAK